MKTLEPIFNPLSIPVFLKKASGRVMLLGSEFGNQAWEPEARDEEGGELSDLLARLRYSFPSIISETF
jgi:hypothetical protein